MPVRSYAAKAWWLEPLRWWRHRVDEETNMLAADPDERRIHWSLGRDLPRSHCDPRHNVDEEGHWVMFLVGIFLPIFWLIGALLPKRVR